MARKESQKTKMLVLLDILTHESDEQHPLSVPQLLQRLEAHGIIAERKSIYNDIQCLKEEMNYDIELVRGPRGGYYLAAREFELPDLKLLVDAVQSSKFINEDHSRKLIDKLSRQTSKYHASELKRQVRLAGRAKTPQNTQYALDTLHGALNDGYMVEFVYNEWSLDKKLVPRKDEPYRVSIAALTYDNGQYYMIGIKAGETRLKNFRVDKMTGVTQLKQKAVATSKQEIDRYVQYVSQLFNMFGGETVQVTLSAPDSLVGVMIDRFGTKITLLREEGRFHFTHPITVSEQFFGWVCGFGGQVRIEAPEAVREQYRAHLDKLTKHF